MMNILSATPESLRARIELLEQQIEDSLIKAQSGKNVDIKSLQKTALHFCDAVVKLPPQEAREFQRNIAEIIRGLDALEKELHDRI